MRTSNLCFIVLIILATICTTIDASYSPLTVGYYKSTCPSAEEIVSNVVNRAVARNPGLGAGLIRMHFHDCFVRGCDASILLDSTPGSEAEKDNRANYPSLRGYEVIDEAKAELEAKCPQTVSCADIIAFAARDSASKLGGLNYAVQGGRRDGRVSIKDEPTQDLPAPSFNLQQVQDSFNKKGFSVEEMVTLSGAHSIGVSHCSSFDERLYNFNNVTNTQDPSLDPTFANTLKATCPINNSPNCDPTVDLDFVTPNKLDNKYYKIVQNGKALFTSDQTLMTSSRTAGMVRNFGRQGGVWAKKFAKAMVHMGSIEVLTGFEVRGSESELSMEAAEYEYNEEGAFSFVSELPKVMPPEGETELVKWKGFWVMPEIIKAVMGIETQFEPLPSDIILISFPKTGTTWLKALTVTLLNHHNSKQNPSLQTDDPLLTKTPHQLVPFLELQCFGDNPTFDISTMTSPRVFNTHLPYSMLPDCIKNSGCRQVYITRNPMDTFVSHWHFYYKKLNKETTMDEAFEHFCQGFIRGGPYFEHVLDYWKVSNEKEGILYLTYEELKVDPNKHVKRLADFLAFSLDQADIQRVVSKCSFDRLSNLDVNKGASNIQWADWDSSAYFRRGVIGDAVNYLTPDKVAQLKKMAEEKWAGSGLTLCSAELFMTV